MSLHSRNGSSRGQLRQLGELLTFRNDIVHPKDRPTGMATFVGLEHIERDTGIRIGAEQIDLSEMTGRRARFYPGDIVYGYLRPYLNKVWRADFEGLCSVDQYVFRISAAADPSYIAYFLRSQAFLRTAPVDSTPGQLPRIRSGEIAETAVFLPPLNEQRRIAAILDQTDDLRRKRRAALERMQFLAITLFRSLFGDQTRNERRLPVSSIGALEVEMTYGPRYYNEEYSADGVRIVRITDLREDGSLDWEAMPKLTLPRKELEKSAARPGELLFARTGATVGKLALIKDADPICIPGAYFIRMKFPPSVNPTYAWYVLRSAEIQAIILNGSRQSAQQNFSGPGLRRLPFLMPPLDLQQHFAFRIAEIDELKASYRAHLAKLDALFASLQHRAFRGEL